MRIAFLLALTACGGSPPSPVTPAEASPSPGADEPVATWKGGSVTLGEVEAKVQAQLDSMEQEYQLQRYQVLTQALDGAVDEALIEAKAKEEGLADAAALLKREVEDQVVRPTDEELQMFYEEVKGQLRGAPFEVVREMLANELTQRSMAARYTQYVKDLRAEAGVKGQIPYPDLKKVELAVSDTDPVLGDPDAPVSIVQFAEYQCYFCNKVNPTLKALVDDYDGKVNVVFKDFPLGNHQRAMPAAVAARCAGDQDQYWAMNEILLANQSALEDADFKRYAQNLALDTEAFDACLTSGRHDAAIRAAFAQGEAVGVQATPTFYVNGVLVSGAQPYQVFQTVIDQELARK
jgi:protein-disulfide isomerase